MGDVPQREEDGEDEGVGGRGHELRHRRVRDAQLVDHRGQYGGDADATDAVCHPDQEEGNEGRAVEEFLDLTEVEGLASHCGRFWG